MRTMRISSISAPADSDANRLNRRDFLKIVSAGIMAVPLASCNRNKIRPKPNIVVIFADDIDGYALYF